VVSVADSTLALNGLRGGAGGRGGNGLGQSFFYPAGNGGAGGAGGPAQGGSIYQSAGTLTVTNSTVALNNLRGGTGAAGGTGGPGSPSGAGGNGGNGGLAQGGGLFVASGTLQLTNATVAQNQVQPTLGGVGGGGSTQGLSGAPGQANGGGVRIDTGAVINALNTIFGNNVAPWAPDFYGNFTTASHNLLEVDTGSNLPPGNPDPNGNLVGSKSAPIDPLLGPLANNGGPTETMALLSGSPAIDAGTAAGAPATDQRGEARGTPPDIGAYEDVGDAGPSQGALASVNVATTTSTFLPVLGRPGDTIAINAIQTLAQDPARHAPSAADRSAKRDRSTGPHGRFNLASLQPMSAALLDELFLHGP
jgi:hypothetical protein